MWEKNKNFIEHIKNLQLQERECITPYYFLALFTSVPLNLAMGIIKPPLDHDPEPSYKTKMRNRRTIEHITYLLEFCLKIFLFPGKYFK